MKKRRFAGILLSLTLAAASIGFAYADEVTVCPEESPAATVAAAQAAASIKAMKPELKAASYSYNKIKLSWEKVGGADGYQIYRATKKNGKFSRIATVGAEKSEYINTKLSCGKTYYYKVRAFQKNGSKKIYSKYSAVTSAKVVPSKTAVKDVWGGAVGGHRVTVEWKGIAGATDYQVQYRYTMNGKTSDWKNKVKSVDGEWLSFKTYNTAYKNAKKKYPSGYVEGVILAGYDEDAKIPLNEYVTKAICTKNQAIVSWVPQDDRVYELRVRAYRTVNGKKIYGAWSNPFTLTERLDVDAAYKELVKFTKEYAAKNHPKWKYIEDNADMRDNNSSYYTYGVLGGSSRYVKTEDFVERYKERIANYINMVKGDGGESVGTIFIKKVKPGDTEGIWKNDTNDTYYKVWMLF